MVSLFITRPQINSPGANQKGSEEMKRGAMVLVAVLGLSLGLVCPAADFIGDEFPITATAGNELGLSAAFDGTNYLVGIQGDAAGQKNITAQMISQTGTLVGSRISVGRTGEWCPAVGFDGTNYLMVWPDDANSPNDDIYGQFVSPSGTLVGSPFAISTAPGRQGNCSPILPVIFDGTNYLVVWEDYYNEESDIYGQLVSPSGTLVGSEIPIATDNFGDGDDDKGASVAFDGTNYLVVFSAERRTGLYDGEDIYGQFVAKNGSLVDPNFIIDQNDYPSSNPTAVIFDGTRYVASFWDELSPQHDAYYARFVAKDGAVSPTRITLYEGQTSPLGCFVQGFDGTNYLVALSEGGPVTPYTAKGRYYDINFNAVGDWFTIFNTQNSKVPLGPCVVFADNKYLAVATRAEVLDEGDYTIVAEDVYGIFFSTSPVTEEKIGVYRPSSGLWAIRDTTRTYFGGSDDTPVYSDFDGDGVKDIAVFRPGSGLWAIQNITRVYFGSSTDESIPGDYNGDGSCDLGIFRAGSGLWAVRGITRAYFGGSGDTPVPGDYDGDHSDDLGVYREGSGLWAVRGVSRVYFGGSTDDPVPGDYNGSGYWSPGIFRSSSGLWAIRGVTRSYFGSSSDLPVPADYDGSGMDNIGIFRETSGLWAISGITRAYFGGSSDIPVTR